MLTPKESCRSADGAWIPPPPPVLPQAVRRAAMEKNRAARGKKDRRIKEVSVQRRPAEARVRLRVQSPRRPSIHKGVPPFRNLICTISAAKSVFLCWKSQPEV